MYIHRVRLRNIRQHPALDVELAQFTCIVGENRVGKSNLLLSIRDALNLSNRISNGRENLVTWGRTSGRIEVDFSVGPADEVFTAVLRAGGRDAGRSITNSAGEVLAATPDSTVEFLSGLFGSADQTVIDSLVFARQTNSLDVLFQRGGPRAKLAQRVVGTSGAERVSRLAAEALSTMGTVDPDGIARTLLWLDGQEQAEDLAIASAEAAVAAAQGLPTLAEIDGRISAAAAAAGAPERLREAEDEASSLRATITAREKTLEAHRRTMAGFTSAGIRKMLDAASELVANRERRTALAAERESVSALLAGISSPEGHRSRADALEAELERIVRRTPAASLMSQLEEGHECPLCLREGVGAADLARVRDRTQSDNGEYERISAEKAEALASARQSARDMRPLQDRLGAIDREVAGMPAETREPDPGSVRRLEAALKAAIDTESEMGRIEAQLVADGESLVRVVSRVGSAREAASLSEPLPVPELVAMRDVVSASIAAEDRLVALRAARVSRGAERRRLADERSRYESVSRTREALVKMRDLFEYRSAPLVYATSTLERITGGMNQIISLMGFQYIVSAGDEFDFLMSENGGNTWAPAELLSGGEKAALVMAFRIEACRAHASGVRIMTMDEPTPWMDEARRAQFPQVLRAMRGIALSQGLQFLVITHDRETLPCFERVIELGPR